MLSRKTVFSSNRTGFTLIESVLVLFMTALVLGITLMGISVFQNPLNNEKRFFQTLNSAWDSTILLTQDQQLDTDVLFYPHDKVVFVSYGKKRNFVKKVKEPKTLSVCSYHDVKIKKDGYVRPQTINWRSDSKNKIIRQKIQLGWGSYRLEVSDY